MAKAFMATVKDMYVNNVILKMGELQVTILFEKDGSFYGEIHPLSILK